MELLWLCFVSFRWAGIFGWRLKFHCGHLDVDLGVYMYVVDYTCVYLTAPSCEIHTCIMNFTVRARLGDVSCKNLFNSRDRKCLFSCVACVHNYFNVLVFYTKLSMTIPDCFKKLFAFIRIVLGQFLPRDRLIVDVFCFLGRYWSLCILHSIFILQQDVHMCTHFYPGIIFVSPVCSFTFVSY